MNKNSRSTLSEVVSNLNSLKEMICIIKDEEQEKFDNLPEGLKQSNNGECMENAVNNLEEAENQIDDVISSLESAVEC